MEYLRALSAHSAARLLLFSGAMGLLSAFLGDVSFESERAFFSVESEIRSRRLNALFGSACVLGGGVLLLAASEFRPPSYPLLPLGCVGGICLVMPAFKLMFRSAEAMESTFTKGALLLLNGLTLALSLTATRSFYDFGAAMLFSGLFFLSSFVYA